MKKDKANQQIRNALENSGVFYWQLADILGISQSTLTVRLRHELPDVETKRILRLIEENAEKRKEMYGIS